MPSRNKILASLGDAAALRLKRIELVQGAVLHPAGRPIKHVYFPVSGMISLLAMLRTGGQVETAVIGREGAVGSTVALFGGNPLGQATVQIAGSALSMTSSAFVTAYARAADLREAINAHFAFVFAQTQQSAACHAHHPVEERLGRWLLQSRDAVGSDRVRLTQEFLAHMLGVQRSAVSIAAIAMQNTGLIRYSRGNITLLDRAAIRERSCECYDVLNRFRAGYLKSISG